MPPHRFATAVPALLLPALLSGCAAELLARQAGLGMAQGVAQGVAELDPAIRRKLHDAYDVRDATRGRAGC